MGINRRDSQPFNWGIMKTSIGDFPQEKNLREKSSGVK